MAQQFAEIDPNVSIPPAVKALAARADEAFKQAYAPEEVQNGEEGQQEAPAGEIEGKIENAPAPEAQDLTSQSNETKAKPEDEQSWEHRYKSMKGRFDRSETHVRALSEQVASLQNIIATMQVQQSTQGDDYSELRAERLITPEEEQDYGSEFLSVVGKKAKEELSPEVAQLKKEIAGLKSQLAGVGGYVQQDARSRMETTMNERLPNWQDVNVDPNFLSWLKLPDPYSGVIRHELLKAAYERNDTPRVMAFFQGFLAEEAATAPVDDGPDDLRVQSAAPKVPLEKFAAPGRAKTAAASGAPAEKPSFTRAQIAKFYADSAAGKYRGKEAEKDRVERQIFDAEREGRIR
jgi:hypothetical protein